MSKKKKVTKTKAKRQARQSASGVASQEQQEQRSRETAAASQTIDTEAPFLKHSDDLRPLDSQALIASRETLIDYLNEIGPKIKVEPRGGQDAELLAKLDQLLSPKEQQILKESGAFTDVTLEPDQKLPDLLKLADFDWFAGDTNPPPPVVVQSAAPKSSSDLVLSKELRYLSTVLEPAEMRHLLCELTIDWLRSAPVTHTDVSDSVIASIMPSIAQRYAFKADAQYKYTTAQFLQVYLKLRYVVTEFKIMLGGAKADALVLSQLPFSFPPYEDSDDGPVSAVEALREWIKDELEILDSAGHKPDSNGSDMRVDFERP